MTLRTKRRPLEKGSNASFSGSKYANVSDYNDKISDCSSDKKEPRVLDSSSNLETGKEMVMTCENSEADVVFPEGQRGITSSICSGKHGGGTLLDNMEVEG